MREMTVKLPSVGDTLEIAGGEAEILSVAYKRWIFAPVVVALLTREDSQEYVCWDWNFHDGYPYNGSYEVSQKRAEDELDRRTR